MSTQVNERYNFQFKEGAKFATNCNSIFDIKLYFTLTLMLKFGNCNCIFIKQSKLAETIGCSQPAISRSVKNLIKAKAIAKLSGGYMVNPVFNFIGNLSDINIAIARWHKL